MHVLLKTNDIAARLGKNQEFSSWNIICLSYYLQEFLFINIPHIRLTL